MTFASIGEGPTILYAYLFSSCEALSSAVLPTALKTIEYRVFESCSSLSAVYYRGNQEQWGVINIDSDNSALQSATVYYYSESEPLETGNFWHYIDDTPVLW